MNNNYFEAVEVCPHCDSENTYPMWDTAVKGYVAVCKYCGKEIFLCDECRHAEDNPNMNCDWRKTHCGGKCFRGTTGNSQEMTIDDVVRRLNDGLDRTEEELAKCKNWLLEYQLANDMTLKELDDLCFEDSNWIFDNIFG